MKLQMYSGEYIGTIPQQGIIIPLKPSLRNRSKGIQAVMVYDARKQRNALCKPNLAC